MTSLNPAVTGSDRTRLHYARLLAPIYGWMLGDLDAAMKLSHAELRELGVGAARTGDRALDLGAGLGLQTIPLVELGYQVTAVDASEPMLWQLARACPTARLVLADLTRPEAFPDGPYDVVTCMGDTLTHLRSLEEVRSVLEAAAAQLSPGGRLVLTFRDYTAPPPPPAGRFLLIRADAHRLLTCCLDYGPERVRVTDVVHELGAGGWTLRASDYEKLRLHPAAVAAELAARGLTVDRCQSEGGRVTVTARRGRARG